MNKRYIINGDLGSNIILVGTIDNGFNAVTIIEFKNDDIVLLSSKSSLKGKEEANILEETTDIFNKCKSDSSVEDIASMLQEKGYTEYKINKNIYNLWTRLSSLKQQEL